MPAHVEVEALVIFRARDSADDVVFLQDDGPLRMARQLVGRRETCGPAADDDELLIALLLVFHPATLHPARTRGGCACAHARIHHTTRPSFKSAAKTLE